MFLILVQECLLTLSGSFSICKRPWGGRRKRTLLEMSRGDLNTGNGGRLLGGRLFSPQALVGCGHLDHGLAHGGEWRLPVFRVLGRASWDGSGRWNKSTKPPSLSPQALELSGQLIDGGRQYFLLERNMYLGLLLPLLLCLVHSTVEIQS